MNPYRTVPGVSRVSDVTFESEVLASPIPVLVAFGAPWSKPSVDMLPVLQRIATEHAGKYKVVTVDIDRAPHIAKTHGIRLAPTIMVFRSGSKVVIYSGAADERLLLGFLGEREEPVSPWDVKSLFAFLTNWKK